MSDDARLVLVVLSYNGLEDTRKCLLSVKPALRPFVTPLVVDNGSTDGTSAAVSAEFPWCPIVRVDTNRGPAAGNNAGLREGLRLGADWIVLLNNDTTVHPDLFDRLRDAALAHPEYDVIGPVIYFMDDPTVVMTDGCVFNPPIPRGFFLRKEVPLAASHPPRVVDVDIVNGCCMMVRAETIARVGTFDERLFMYHDELDLCLRIQAAGGRLGVIDHGLVWHKGSATSRSTGKRSIRYFDARNLMHVLRKQHGATRNGRSRWLTRRVYLRYMYDWYIAERESGNQAAAAAVVDGICDGLAGRFGPYEARRRPLAPGIRVFMNAARRLPKRRSAPAATAPAR